MTAPNPYADLVGGADPLALLSKTPHRIADTVEGWDARRWSRPYAPGKWTGAQVMLHLAHDEIVWGGRVRMALSEPAYVVQPMDGGAWVSRESPPDPLHALGAYTTLRHLDIDLWNRLSPAERERPFRHPEFGDISAGWILALLAGHDLHHLAHLEAIAAAG